MGSSKFLDQRPATSRVFLTRRRQIPACAFTRKEMSELFEQLEKYVERERAREISAVLQTTDYNDEQVKKLEQTVKRILSIIITITVENGEAFVGDSKTFPDEIENRVGLASFYFDNSNTFQAEYGTSLRNRFSLRLEFDQPAAFDLSNPTTAPESNSSNFEVSGEDNWVHAVFAQFDNFFGRRKTNRDWLHGSGIFDLFAWTFFLPLGFWILFRIGNMLERVDIPTILEIGGGIFVIVTVMFIYRYLFIYARWLFPLIKIADMQRRPTWGHKTFWGLSILGVVTGGIYNFVGFVVGTKFFHIGEGILTCPHPLYQFLC